jgi:hypothetical protein
MQKSISSTLEQFVRTGRWRDMVDQQGARRRARSGLGRGGRLASRGVDDGRCSGLRSSMATGTAASSGGELTARGGRGRRGLGCRGGRGAGAQPVLIGRKRGEERALGERKWSAIELH